VIDHQTQWISNVYIITVTWLL